MRFYQQQHRFYCGVDLHARSMHVCIVDHEGQTKVHKNHLGDARPARGTRSASAQLRWAFGEAACLMLRELPAAQTYVARLEKQHGRPRRFRFWRRGWPAPPG